MLDSVLATVPLWLTFCTAACVLLLTVAGGRAQPAPVRTRHLSLVALFGLGGAITWLLYQHGRVEAFGGALVVDGIAVVFGLVALSAAFLSVLLASAYMEEQGLSLGEFVALILLCAVGMLMVVMAGDLLVFFIGIETMSLAVYVLAGYRRASRRSQEAALKYFIYGAYASAFVLFGMALLYGELGRITGKPGLSFAALGKGLTKESVSSLGWIGIALVLSGLGFKVAAVPFHMWAPDVYEGAPTPATGFMAVGIKAAAFAGLCRFLSAGLPSGFAAEAGVAEALEVLALLTVVVGNLLAVRQSQLKRMLAYSSIAHAGYLLVGLVAFVREPDGQALQAIAYYLLGYTAMTLGAFGVLSAFERRADRRLEMSVEKLAGVATKHPALALAMSLFLFSLAGLPPTAGFVGKLSLFYAAVQTGRTTLVLVAIISSLVGAYYYLRVVVAMYMKTSDHPETAIQSSWLSVGVSACAAITLVTGLLPETVFVYARYMFAQH